MSQATPPGRSTGARASAAGVKAGAGTKAAASAESGPREDALVDDVAVEDEVAESAPVVDGVGPPELPAGVTARPGTAPLWSALTEVLDPEFPISVVDMGLIYDIRRDGGRIEVDLTFTATACPCMDFIKDDVRERLERIDGIGDVVIQVVWDPPWTRERMTAAARQTLRKFGVAA